MENENYVYNIKICYGIMFPVVKNIKIGMNAEIDEVRDWIEDMINDNTVLCVVDMKERVHCIMVNEIRNVIIKKI